MTDKILVIDDEADIRDVLADIFEDEGYHVLKAAHSEQAFQVIDKEEPNLIVVDIWLENSDLDGIGILKRLKKNDCPHNAIPVLMISGHGNIEMAVKAMKIGAYDFIEKPFKIDHILLTAQRALEQQHLLRENSDLKYRIYHDTDEYKTKSPQLQALLKTIQDDRTSDARVLITGAIGTGKSKLARHIHQLSPRSDRPLYTYRAADIDKTTASEWYTAKKFDGCTILIEDIDYLSRPAQTCLLKLLSDHTDKSCPRLISTLSGDPKPPMIDNVDFSSALFDRLAVLHYNTPDLHNRKEDFADMVRYFSTKICETINLSTPTFSSEAIVFLQEQTWPGNITQLKSVIELLSLNRVLSDTPTKPITAKDVKGTMPNNNSDQANHDPVTVNSLQTKTIENESNDYNWGKWFDLPLREAREQFEILYLTHTLNYFQGNISKMADHIDMERTALHRKLKSMDIHYDMAHRSKMAERKTG